MASAPSIDSRIQQDLLDRARRDLIAGAYEGCLHKIDFLLTDMPWDAALPVLCVRMMHALATGARHEAANIAFYLTGGFAADLRASAVREALDGFAGWGRLRHLGVPLDDPAALIDGLAASAAPAEYPAEASTSGRLAVGPDAPLVVVSLVSGMGNQLFQYAAALRRARCSGGTLKFDLSLFASDRFGTRPFALAAFAIDVPLATLDDMARVEPHTLPRDLTRADAALMSGRGDCRLLGYWSSARYFRGVEDELRETLRLRDSAATRRAVDAVARVRRRGPVIGVHVRRGDYLSPLYRNTYAPPPIEYFRAALRHFPGDRAVVLFSDTPGDRDWCAETFADLADVVEVSRDRSDIDDFAYLAACDHQIISVSSFSWWAAWLNPNPTKQVVAPHPALGVGPRHAHTHMAGRLPSDWRVLCRDDLE
jgi:hypothetical protein